MANPEHLAILKQGVEAWNKWKGRISTLHTDLSNANLEGEELPFIDFRQTILCGANLSHANLDKSSLLGVNLACANLHTTSLVECDISNSDLSNADMERSDLTLSFLQSARMSNANLRKAKLIGANLLGAELDGSDFCETIFGATVIEDSDLSCTRNLERAEHRYPSVLGINCIYNSRGRIPMSFLRGVGLPDSFLDYVEALTIKPIQYYSCFISYSTKNQEFADRIHSDLDNKGVRNWLATEDLKIGDKFRTRIEESIRLHDKLLLVLSETSVASPWVESEVESAMERERRENRLILFPVMLDNAVMDTNVAWAANIRRTRHIGDFCDWKNHDSYKKAFHRLLSDLKAENPKQKE